MAGFLTGFITGAANRANEITQENERQRNAVIERSMQAFRATVERRRTEMQEQQGLLAQAQTLARAGRIHPNDVQAAARTPEFLSNVTSGRFSFDGGGNNPAPITGQGGLMAPPSATPTAPSAPGLGQPSQTPIAPSGEATVAPQMQDPRPAISDVITAPQQPTQASPDGPPQGGIMNGIRRAVFGRNPFEGVGEEVRNRYAQESGMTRQQVEALNAPQGPIPQMQGNYRVNNLTPEQMVRSAGNFQTAEGIQAFNRTGDTSGLRTGDIEQRDRIAAAVAGRSPREPREHIVPPAAFTAAERAMAGFLPGNGSGLLRAVPGPNGEVSVGVNLPGSGGQARYIEGQQALERGRQAIGRALRGEVPGVPPNDPSAAGAYAAREAGVLGNRTTTTGDDRTTRVPPPGGATRTPGNPTTVAPRDTGVAPPATQGSRINPFRNVTPEQIATLPIGSYYVGPDGNTRQRVAR